MPLVFLEQASPCRPLSLSRPSVQTYKSPRRQVFFRAVLATGESRSFPQPSAVIASRSSPPLGPSLCCGAGCNVLKKKIKPKQNKNHPPLPRGKASPPKYTGATFPAEPKVGTGRAAVPSGSHGCTDSQRGRSGRLPRSQAKPTGDMTRLGGLRMDPPPPVCPAQAGADPAGSGSLASHCPLLQLARASPSRDSAAEIQEAQVPEHQKL